MSVFLNGDAVSALALTVPRIGPWHADVSLTPNGTQPSGKVTLSVFGVEYKGAVLRSGVTKALPFARIIGGAGGLGTVLPPKTYQGTDVKLPLSEILQGVKESLSPTSDTAALAKRLPFWVRVEGTAGESLASVLSLAGIPCWRVLRDGTVWVGSESWPASGLTDVTLLERDPHLGRYDFYAEKPAVFPGETWDGHRVSVVEHRFTADSLVTSVWVEPEGAAGETDRVKAGLEAFVRKFTAPMKYARRYECRVVAQNADLTLELAPDDPEIGTLSNIPIYYGLPGVTAKVPSGARCLLEFLGGSPDKPAVTGWRVGTTTELDFGAAAIAFGGGAADALVKGTTYRTAEDLLLTALVTALGTISAATSPSTSAAATTFGTAVTTFKAGSYLSAIGKTA